MPLHHGGGLGRDAHSRRQWQSCGGRLSVEAVAEGPGPGGAARRGGGRGGAGPGGQPRRDNAVGHDQSGAASAEGRVNYSIQTPCPAHNTLTTLSAPNYSTAYGGAMYCTGVRIRAEVK